MGHTLKKNLLAIIVALATSATLFASGATETATPAKNSDGLTVLKVGATPLPHSAMLELVKDDLKAEGVDLEVVEFTDYVTPNEALASGELDANYFQHLPYMESYNKNHGTTLTSAGGIHIEPLALYSQKYQSIDALPSDSHIAIPNDPTNEGRALLLLQSAGLITLNDDASLEATPFDIKDNPKNITFDEIEAASLPRVLSDVAGAVINGNYAIPAGLIATRDGLYIEGADSPYVNIIAVQKGNENNDAIVKLVKALHSQKVKDWVAEQYPNGEVVLVNEEN